MNKLHPVLFHPLTLAAGVLVVFAGFMIGLTGAPGYWVEGWSLMDKAFWTEIPSAYHRGAVEMARPMYTFYVITAMKLLDYNSILLFAASWGLLIASAVMMGGALLWAFPGRGALAAVSVILAGTLPTVTLMVFMVHADNTRLVMVLFWGAVLLYQGWAVRPRVGIIPALPVLLLWLALMTYESVLATLAAIPLFVLPVYWRNNQDRSWWGHVLNGAGLLVSLAFAAGLYFYVRFLYGFSFGGDGIPVERDLLALLANLWAHVVTLPGYFVVGYRVFPYDLPALLVGLAVGGLVGGSLWRWLRYPPSDDAPRPFTEHPAYIALCGLAVFGTAVLPFVVASRTPIISLYEVEMRNFAAAGYGAAVLLALLTLLPFKRVIAGSLALVVAFWVGLATDAGLDRRAAYDTRQTMHTTLAEVAPGMQPETLVLVLGEELIVGDFGVVYFRLGLLDYIRMFYQDFSVYAYGVDRAGDMTRSNTITVSADAVITEDSPPVPPDAVVLLTLERDGRLTLTDCITPEDGWNVAWEDDVTALCSATERIMQPSRRSRFWDILGLP